MISAIPEEERLFFPLLILKFKFARPLTEYKLSGFLTFIAFKSVSAVDFRLFKLILFASHLISKSKFLPTVTIPSSFILSVGLALTSAFTAILLSLNFKLIKLFFIKAPFKTNDKSVKSACPVIFGEFSPSSILIFEVTLTFTSYCFKYRKGLVLKSF